MGPTVDYFLDTRTPVKSQNNRYPFKIRVKASRTQNRAYGKEAGIEYYFTEQEYNEKFLIDRRKEPWKDMWTIINAKIELAEKIIEDMMPFFTFQEFKERFCEAKNYEVVLDESSINYILAKVCAVYLKEDRYPMTVKLKDSVRSILKFAKQENIPMRAITPEFCRRYESYMYKKSKKGSRNGAGINLRHIRIIFNDGIRDHLIPAEWYPFKRHAGEKEYFKDAYVIPNERKPKDYLKEDEVLKFSQATADDIGSESQTKAHWAWLVSYCCNGANAADFLQFRFRHIVGDFIIFYREKVKNANRRDMKMVKVYLSPELIDLIKRYGNPAAPNNYIFPCYKDGMTDEEMYKARKQFTTNVSKSMKFLAKHLGIKKNIRLGNARHSLANILRRNGVDREMFKDLFGHTSIVTADNYYDAFQDDQLKQVATGIMSLNSIEKRVKGKDKAA